MSDNGGPVFGHITSEYDDHRHEYRLSSTVQGELTLRDYFAAKAMHGLLRDAIDKEGFATVHGIAKSAYRMADAMLAERSKP